MAVRKKLRRGTHRLVIEIPYRDSRTGKRVRFRKDAQVQMAAAAQAEDRRLLAQLGQLGYLPTAAELAAAAAPPAEPETPVERYTFGEAVELFRATRAITRLKRTTLRSYEATFVAYLLPRFKDAPLAGVEYAAIAQLDAELVKAGLKPSSRRNVLIALRSVLRSGVEAGRLAEMPKLPAPPKVGRHVVTPPSAEEVALLLAATHPAARLALLIAADAGLRAGEIRGLRWGDVDLDADELVVRRALYDGEADTPKSGHQRMVPLTPRLAAALRAARGPGEPDPEAPAAPSSRGTPWGEWSLRTAFRRAVVKAGLPKARLHDLRHFFVTRCFQAGVDASTVQALAGHAQLAVTARYAHVGDEANRRAIARLGLAP